MTTPPTTLPRPFAPLLSLGLIITLALGVIAPGRALAGNGGAGRVLGAAIVGTALYCATHPQACGAKGGSRGGATGDAIALDRTQAEWVQSGLQATGFYFGAIDGAIGAGTRDAIRDYQAAVGDPATGALSGQQINDLVAVSPQFAPLAGDPVQMLNADLANDLNNDGMFQLQQNLNAAGYDAGTPDGAFGAKTRRAIAAYKAENGLPGAAVASRRLLALMTGGPAPVPAGLQFVAMQDDGMEQDQPAPQPMEAPGEDMNFDLVGITLGMDADAVNAALSKEYGNAFPHETAPDGGFGGGGTLTTAMLAVQPDWPAPGSEQMLTLFDAARPELGLIAAFRLIRMPDGLDRAGFESQVLPGIIAKYGEAAMFGEGREWIGGGVARDAARADANRLLDCGDLRLGAIASSTDAAGALWSQGGGVSLDSASLDSVSADCGDVLRVRFDGTMIRIGLWNSAALSNAVVAPEIKF